MNANEIRDLILEALRKGRATSSAKLDGQYFSGMDIAINDKDGNPEIYRITVISHKPQKQFT